jgi:hypothetical protein
MGTLQYRRESYEQETLNIENGLPLSPSTPFHFVFEQFHFLLYIPKRPISVRYVIVGIQFRVTIATDGRRLTRCMHLSYAVGRDKASCLFVSVDQVSSESIYIFMWVCEV